MLSSEIRDCIPISQPELKGKEYEYLCDAFESSWISSQGHYIDRFEAGFSNYCDSKYGVAVTNGTAALHLALVALGVEAGDEVIIPDLTFAATINAVLHAGARPVIVDIERASWCIDPVKFENAITTNTKAVIVVHLYGQPCNLNSVLQVAHKHGIKVIEDAAQAHGATYNGRKVGSFGDIGCFSFFGNKIITTGEGGMCVTNSSKLNEKLRLFRDHGMNREKKYWHDEVGFNYRLTNLQAAIGCAQLEEIESFLIKRKQTEHLYQSILSDYFTITWQKDFADRKRVAWLVSGLCENPQLRAILGSRGIEVRSLFHPLSSMPIYQEFSSEPCEVANTVSRAGFSLPTYPGINLEKLEDALLASINLLDLWTA